MSLRDFDTECLTAIAGDETLAIDEGSWDGSASNYSDAQYQKACVLDRKQCGGKWSSAAVKERCSLPIRTPSGELSRAGTHAAASRIDQVTDACPSAISSAKAGLRSAYKQLGEDAPANIDPSDKDKKQQGLVDELDVLTGATILETEGRVWCIREETLLTLQDLHGRVISADIVASVQAARAAQPSEAQDAGGGVAVLPLRGVITPRASLLSILFGGGDGSLTTFRRGLAQAVADPGVKAIVMNVDSPGGVVDHVPETAAEIRSARSVKPIVAIANTNAGSAAYWLASQAHEVIVTPSGEVGSIGAYTMHKDVSKAMDRMGIKPTLISAGKYKVEGNPYEPLSQDALEARQQLTNDYYTQFVNDVAKGRNADPQSVQNGYGEGRMLTANRAVRAGLADKVATLPQTIRRLAHNRAVVKGFHTEADPTEAEVNENVPSDSGVESTPNLEKTHEHVAAEAELLFA